MHENESERLETAIFYENELYKSAKDRMAYISMLSELLHQLSCRFCNQFHRNILLMILILAGTPTGSSSADSAKQTAKLNPMESVEKIPISKDKPEADASKTLESVITQVIEWTLKSSNVEQQKVQPNPTNSPVILNPQVNTNSILKTRLNGNTLGPQEGLKIASVETINNSVQAAFNIPGPQVSRAQSFANTPNISINNQFQRSNNFTTGPTIIQVQSQVGASERTNINLQRANSLPQILHVQSLASSTENINFQSNYKRNPETQWRKNAQEAL